MGEGGLRLAVLRAAILGRESGSDGVGFRLRGLEEPKADLEPLGTEPKGEAAEEKEAKDCFVKRSDQSTITALHKQNLLKSRVQIVAEFSVKVRLH